MKLILLIMLCLINSVFSGEVRVRAEYQKTKDGYLCILKNVSPKDVLIKDMKNSIYEAFGKEKDPFKRGKNWTYLRSNEAGFASNSIAINVPAAKIPNNDGGLECKITVASFDKSKRTVGEWVKVKIKIWPSEGKKGSGDKP